MPHEAAYSRCDMTTGVNDSIHISVVVCTFNRSDRLRRALRYICESAARSFVSTEIIVVDNNSTDDTRAVVTSIGRSGTVPVRYVFETAQGLSFARNRGLKEANGRIIVFTDDDCIVDRDWIGAISREFETYPNLAILGGRVDLFNEQDQPVTIRPFSERVLYTDAAQIYGLIIGCNFAITREAARELQGFDPALGGSKGVVADDVEYFYRAFRLGFGVVFSPEVRVYHDHGRRRPEELSVLARGYAKGRGAFFCKYLLKGDTTIMRHAWWELRSQIASAGNAPQPGKLSSGETLAMLAFGAFHFVLSRLGLTRP